MAACAALDRAGQRIAPLIAATGELSETQARVTANALVFGYFAALEQWYLDGGDSPIADYVEKGMRPLRRIWSPSDRAISAPGSHPKSREGCGSRVEPDLGPEETLGEQAEPR
ncbi:hypothetical protein [Streptosporangium sp. NPDC087985]|uniref:hypothetical protein n=1 Tax=Streptosporangium sp. NPDC087985 TaxID=3366196 RepID=UPI00381E408B